MKTYLLDTNVLIELYSQRTTGIIKSFFSKLDQESILAVCGIVLGEFYAGIENKLAEYYSAQLQVYSYLSSQQYIYERAGLTCAILRKKGKNMFLGDCLIAETARYYKAELVTLDKDFKDYPGLKTHVWKI